MEVRPRSMIPSMIKPTVAAATGTVGSLTAFFYGYTNFMAIVGLGLFVFTLTIQYNAVKIKILIPLASGLGFISWALFNSGVSSP